MQRGQYTVELLGFNKTERIVLGSFFGLSSRRSPSFVQHLNAGVAPDILLVDANENAAVHTLLSRNKEGAIPTILIGVGDHGTGWPVLSRPLQWTRLFRAFDLAVLVTPLVGSTNQLASESRQVEKTTQGQLAHSVAAGFNFDRARAFTKALERTDPLAQVLPEPAKSSAAVNQPASESTDRVLVVDDNQTVREFMRSELAPYRFRVDFAESGEEAIEMTGRKHYTCVFLDVVMSGVDGYAVCKAIKSKRQVAKTAVVMLTSKGSPFDRIRGAMAGCDAYLTKPVVEEKLLETIVKFLPRHGST